MMERIIACIPPNPRRVGYIGPIHGPLDGLLYMGSHIHQQPDLNEQEANLFVLKIMQELSDQLEQAEKQLESSTDVATVNRSQPTQMVSLPGYTWGEHHASPDRRRYHVDGQETCGSTMP